MQYGPEIVRYRASLDHRVQEWSFPFLFRVDGSLSGVGSLPGRPSGVDACPSGGSGEHERSNHEQGANDADARLQVNNVCGVHGCVGRADALLKARVVVLLCGCFIAAVVSFVLGLDRNPWRPI